MDEDLDQMSREQLIDAVKKRCGKASVSIGTVHDINSVGITRRSGDSCRRGPIRFLWCRTGRSSCKAA
jgi:hypothetical protein